MPVQAITYCYPFLEGTSNSPDIWNAVNGLNQQGYEGALGAATTHQTQPGSYSSLQPPPHSHLVRFTSRTLDVDSTAFFKPPLTVMCVCLPFRTTLHIQWWLLTWTEVSHPCPLSTATTQRHALRRSTPQRIQQVRKWRKYYSSGLSALFGNILQCVFFFSVSGNKGHVSGGSQTGDTLGKALASVSMHHLNPIRPAHLCRVMFKRSDQSIKASPESPGGIMQKENSGLSLPLTAYSAY